MEKIKELKTTNLA